jgi:hypothetical protein
MHGQYDLFERRTWLPPRGRSSLPFCEVTVTGSSLGDEYHCSTCGSVGLVPLTASNT